MADTLEKVAAPLEYALHQAHRMGSRATALLVKRWVDARAEKCRQMQAGEDCQARDAYLALHSIEQERQELLTALGVDNEMLLEAQRRIWTISE